MFRLKIITHTWFHTIYKYAPSVLEVYRTFGLKNAKSAPLPFSAVIFGVEKTGTKGRTRRIGAPVVKCHRLTIFRLGHKNELIKGLHRSMYSAGSADGTSKNVTLYDRCLRRFALVFLS